MIKIQPKLQPKIRRGSKTSFKFKSVVPGFMSVTLIKKAEERDNSTLLI